MKLNTYTLAASYAALVYGPITNQCQFEKCANIVSVPNSKACAAIIRCCNFLIVILNLKFNKYIYIYNSK